MCPVIGSGASLTPAIMPRNPLCRAVSAKRASFHLRPGVALPGVPHLATTLEVPRRVPPCPRSLARDQRPWARGVLLRRRTAPGEARASRESVMPGGPDNMSGVSPIAEYVWKLVSEPNVPVDLQHRMAWHLWREADTDAAREPGHNTVHGRSAQSPRRRRTPTRRRTAPGEAGAVRRGGCGWMSRAEPIVALAYRRLHGS